MARQAADGCDPARRTGPYWDVLDHEEADLVRHRPDHTTRLPPIDRGSLVPPRPAARGIQGQADGVPGVRRSRSSGPAREEDDPFRAALEGHGVATADWWERQLGLCLLGAVVQFGWEKAYGEDDELGWWLDAARAGARWL